MSKYCVTGEKFINPYNFVSIDETVSRSEAAHGALSGTISCELKTLTPLFIPNTTKDMAFSTGFSHSYDFFSYEDLNARNDYRQNPARPIIPGSSIRGVVRSAFEAVNNGCMSTCDDENTLYRRTSMPRKFYGIIEKDSSTQERVLYKASKWKWSVGDRVSHKTGDVLRGGIYLRGENFSGKKNDAIMKYELTESGEKIELARFSEDDRQWTNLVEVWRLYQQRDGKIKGVNQSRDHKGYSDYLTADQIPVYYTKLDDSDFYYFSPAAITKEVFSRTLSELLKLQGGHQPCRKRDSMCTTCRLFGMVGEESQASRLFFHDATPVAPDGQAGWRDWYEAVRALPILASPKVSATEFYMEDVDGAAIFNYDYTTNYYTYFDENNRRAEAPVRAFFENQKLRGRKFYWHRKDVVLDNTSEFKNQRTEIRPVGKDKTFRFEIGFDRLTQAELETLLWVLSFGEKNATYAHKLGYAKPYGYGSVRIVKADVSVVTLTNDLALDKKLSTAYTPQEPEDSKAVREYMKLTDFSAAKDNVKYPIGNNGKGRNAVGVYQWFGINKEIRLGAFRPSFNYVLPTPLDNDIALPGYAPGNGHIGGNRAEILPADVPEKQSEIPVPQTTTPQSTSVGELQKQRNAENEAKSTPKYGTYRAADIKAWLIPYNRAPKVMKALGSFIKDYDRAQDANDNRYKDLAHLYDKAKEKCGNG